MEQREMNFFDLCAALGRAIGRGCAFLWGIFCKMLRLTYKYWYVVITLALLSAAAAIYHTRPKNIKYRVNAVAFLNGASIQQFEQAFEPLRSGCLLPPDAAINQYKRYKQANDFKMYRVVDALGDGTPDYIDFKQKSSPKDTIMVQMHDRVCIQFCTPAYAIPMIPEIERAVLELLNGNEALQQSYTTYYDNLRDKVAFNHRQAIKLDSLTSAYYYNAGAVAGMASTNGNGVNFYGDRRIRLFLDEIYAQQQHTRLDDYRLQFATAPVVLENHFAVNPAPVQTRMKCTLMFILFGWLAGCVLAEIIDKRKSILAWFAQ